MHLFFSARKSKLQLHPKWIISSQLPWYKRPSVLTSFLISSTCILGSYIYINYALQNTIKSLTEITKKYNELSDKYTDLKIAKVKLQRELEVAQQSQVKIKDNLLSMHQQSQDLTEQVDLYKRVMSATDTSERILVENLALTLFETNNNKNLYNISFLLLQATKKKILVDGTVDVHINGKLGDVSKTIIYSKNTNNKNFPLSYRFRDFQQVNEKIELPAGFKPEQVLVSITDRSTKQTKVTNFDWGLVGGNQINVAKK